MINRYEVQIKCATCGGMKTDSLNAEEYQAFIEFGENGVHFYCASCAVLESERIKSELLKEVV